MIKALNKIMNLKNKNIRVEHIFENVILGGIVYWEFKAILYIELPLKSLGIDFAMGTNVGRN